MKINQISNAENIYRINIQNALNNNKIANIENATPANNLSPEEFSDGLSDKESFSQVFLDSKELKMLQTPISSIRHYYSDVLESIHEENGVPDELYNQLKSVLDKGSIGLRPTYKKYYELLDLCETENDIRTTYPEISYPKNPLAVLADVENRPRFIRVKISERYKEAVQDELQYLETQSGENNELITDLTEQFSTDELKSIVNSVKELDDAKEILTSYRHPKESIPTMKDILSSLKLDGTPLAEQIYNSARVQATSNLDPKTYAYRLKDANYADIVKDVLKKLYLDWQPLAAVNVRFPDGKDVRANDLAKYDRGEWSKPDAKLVSLIRTSMSTRKALLKLSDDLSAMDENTLNTLARQQSTKRFWKDFNNYTNGDWMPIRLIVDRKKHPDTTIYTLDNLTTAYMYRLYKISQKTGGEIKGGSNPLAKFEHEWCVSKFMKNVVDSAYLDIYHDKQQLPIARKFFHNSNTLNYDKDFVEFCKTSNLDKEAIKKSFEKLERRYQARFYRFYVTPARVELLQKDLVKTVNLINEKLAYRRTNKPKLDNNISMDETKKLVKTSAPQEVIDEDKFNRFGFLVRQIQNSELKARCEVCLSDSNIDVNYFEDVYSIIEKSMNEDGILDEIKALSLMKLGDKYQAACDKDISFDDFVARELNSYKKSDGSLDYDTYYNYEKTELELYSQLDKLEEQGDFDLYNLVMDLMLSNLRSNREMLTLLEDYQNVSPRLKKIVGSKISQYIDECDSIDDKDIAANEISELLEKVNSWNFDKPDVINSKFAGKVVITPRAKMELWKSVNGNVSLFDRFIKKFYAAAGKNASKDGEAGIKAVKNIPNAFELKIMGNGGGMRMYSGPITQKDIEKYKTPEDDSDVKYIFDSYSKHL